MIRLSVNVLTSAIELLRRLNTYRYSSVSELAYSKIVSISAEDIFDFASKCGWANKTENILLVTSRGVGLLFLYEEGRASELKRQMLMDYVLRAAPIWSNRIPYGRKEATIFMSKDETACFSDAGLLSDQLDSDIIDWWDTIANQIRLQTQQEKNDTGRTGERNTIKYEKMRTNIMPKWMAVDSNLLGYDIKSVLSKDDHSSLLIEVKSSMLSIHQASFHITAHEWEVALTNDAYVFHLWSFWRNKRLLAVISPHDVQPYIPTNNLGGEWESTKIPFACFENRFVEIE